MSESPDPSEPPSDPMTEIEQSLLQWLRGAGAKTGAFPTSDVFVEHVHTWLAQVFIHLPPDEFVRQLDRWRAGVMQPPQRDS